MSLKTVAIACAIASLITLTASIGNAIYIISNSYDQAQITGTLFALPYWAFLISNAIFFFLFSKRM